ncbi:hypothetical protein K505DRAFT_27193 [Melanomma pulvis-pyrius CBS 109.77]|uniref:Transmembrane protein n=1 Tax=Melanomma pulvis-pyrius CBS 109.77 TaxID=1314802 RepID=A0A6A6XDB6_9PLEO|nr:hypothetical protein K505DRAFT_27193 [Melanomma pulvis-pyrius CBS 109.77]
MDMGVRVRTLANGRDARFWISLLGLGMRMACCCWWCWVCRYRYFLSFFPLALFFFSFSSSCMAFLLSAFMSVSCLHCPGFRFSHDRLMTSRPINERKKGARRARRVSGTLSYDLRATNSCL